MVMADEVPALFGCPSRFSLIEARTLFGFAFQLALPDGFRTVQLAADISVAFLWSTGSCWVRTFFIRNQCLTKVVVAFGQARACLWPEVEVAQRLRFDLRRQHISGTPAEFGKVDSETGRRFGEHRTQQQFRVLYFLLGFWTCSSCGALCSACQSFDINPSDHRTSAIMSSISDPQGKRNRIPYLVKLRLCRRTLEFVVIPETSGSLAASRTVRLRH